MAPDHPLQWLLPWEFSWLAVLVFLPTAALYLRGQRRLAGTGDSPGGWRGLAFWTGLGLSYAVLHTGFDYYAQYMFFVHRGQHLVLHHLAPLLIALANPWRTLAAGFPEGNIKGRLAGALEAPPVRVLYRVLQHPLVAPVLFVGLIFFWLWPEIHFDAMLSHPLYLLMNWSMLIDGVLFWWLLLDPRDPSRVGTLGFGKRIILLWVATVPQLALGAHITFSRENLYDVYAVCGRAWPISPMTDQILGGVLTWIPPGMMAAIAFLILLSRMIRHADRNATPTTPARAGEG